ncbi:prepilin-type N-terminal cleavage/methylation domain-containing protein [Candidatus Latescibacterota bacterium]
MTNLKQQKGFTLVEIIIAATMLLVGVAMFASVVSRVLNQNFHSHKQTQAVILAQNKIEFLINDGYNSNNLNDGAYSNPLNPVNETGDSSGVFYQTWEVEDVNPIEKAKLITSIVEWEDFKGVTQQVILTAVCIDESN